MFCPVFVKHCTRTPTLVEGPSPYIAVYKLHHPVPQNLELVTNYDGDGNLSNFGRRSSL